MRDVVVVDSVRTGLAKSFRGSFNWTRSDDMAAFLIDALIDRNPNFDQVKSMTSSWARQTSRVSKAAISRAWLFSVEATDRGDGYHSESFLCLGTPDNRNGSKPNWFGLYRCHDGGRPSLSRCACVRRKVSTSRTVLARKHKPEVFMQMGNTAEVVARRYNVTRESQDEYALQSQQRYAQAVDAGAIQEEIVPMPPP